MDSKQLKHLADQHNFSIEKDPIYSAIKYHTELENLIIELGRNDYRMEGGTLDPLDQICLSSLALRYSKWDFLDSRYFKSFWSGGGQLFEVPPFIDKAEYNKAEIRLRIMAANIAVRLNTETDEFDSYLSDRKKNGNWLAKYFDQLFFFSLGAVQYVGCDYADYLKLLEGYTDSPFSQRWIADIAWPIVNVCQSLKEKPVLEALEKWESTYGSGCLKYYPVQSHYKKGKNAHTIAVTYRDNLVNRWRNDFEAAAAGFVNQDMLVRNEMKSFKERYFGSAGDDIDGHIHDQLKNQDMDFAINSRFQEVLQWAKVKAAATWVNKLADYSNSNRAKIQTDLSIYEFSTLSYFFKKIGLFKSQLEAAKHLAIFFQGENDHGRAIELNPESLLKKKYRNEDVAEKFILAFGQIRKKQKINE